jgi:RimJ/RimL family protein N-acetyltransferase
MTILQGEYLELRPLPEEDLPRLWKVYQGTPLYFDALGGDVNRLALADVHAQWQNARQNPGRTLFGAYHIVTGLLVGAADVQIDAPTPGAASLWLLIWGGFQRQGYGQECVALVEQWLAEQHNAALTHTIAAENEEGLSFAQLQGFLPTGETAPSPVGSGQVFWMQRDYS